MAFTFTSQTKIFVDAGASPATAVSSGSVGAGVQLKAVADLEDDPDDDVEIVLAIGVNGGAGFRYKTGGGTITLTENRVSEPQINWRRWKRDKKLIAVSTQDENNGPRSQWLPCAIAKVSRTADAEGKHQDKITLKYLQGYH